MNWCSHPSQNVVCGRGLGRTMVFASFTKCGVKWLWADELVFASFTNYNVVWWPWADELVFASYLGMYGTSVKLHCLFNWHCPLFLKRFLSNGVVLIFFPPCWCHGMARMAIRVSKTWCLAGG